MNECDVVMKVLDFLSFDEIIEDFVGKKSRKVPNL